MTGVLGLNYQGQDKEHITQVLNAILAAYSHRILNAAQRKVRRALRFLDEQLPELKQQLDVAQIKIELRQQFNTVDVAKNQNYT